MVEHAPVISVREPSLPGFCAVTEAVRALSNAGVEARGAIFTRREVVDFILDLSGYTSDKPLHELRLLEPSVGEGDFLLPSIERLLTAWKRAGRPAPLKSLAKSLCAVELHGITFETTREKVVAVLGEAGMSVHDAAALADCWLVYGDFLLVDLAGPFDFVVGNPPYVRQELIPDVLIAEYRARYQTVYDRADLYVPFIERSLGLLRERGALGFICADRWTKNRYGGPLRSMVAGNFRLKVFVDMYGTAAFTSDVIAYPAITIITREAAGPTRVAIRPEIERATLARISKDLLAKKLPKVTVVREMRGVAQGSQPWLLDGSDQLTLVRRLEAELPTIEEAGCKVGIGVATGDDGVFIGPFDELNVEPDRKLPLVMTRDILDGTVKWRGFGVINPFADAGGLVDLAKYPKLRSYVEHRKERMAKRHVAQKASANWYRTIDRIYPALTAKPKLLIPDIKGAAHIVYEDGNLYPHHNLYFITSETWDLRALQAVLMSGIARLFVAAYSTKMHGGFLRFQAQYLRRIRVPHWSNVPTGIRKQLIAGATSGDLAVCNQAVFKLYALSETEKTALGGSDK